MKKILFLIESLHLGGAEKSLISLLNNIDLSRYDLEILLYKQGGEFEKFVPKDVKKSYIDYVPSIGERLKFKVFKLLNTNRKYHNAQLLWKSIKSSIPEHERQYDIAIAWGQGFATYFVSKKVRASKKIAWVNIDYEKAGYYAPQDELIYKEFDKIIGVSPFVKEEMKKTYPNYSVMFIRDIVDEVEIYSWSQQKKEIEFNTEELNIVSVGRLAKQKSFQFAIEAIDIVNKKGHKAHLYIIGEGPERGYLESLISEKGMSGQVTLLGYLENPFPYIKDCDIYLQSSIFEGLGRTIIEAGILNKPIVTTNFPTASQILTNNETGIIVGMEPSEIASGIIRLISDNDLKERLVKNLREQSQKETQKTLDAMYQLFDEV
ncbi:glycosyltransferase [Flagellimonas baculiformis]|uniref:glycosyltransferase n=1 Tax=Flagellimonas baculiformis TaxID=3067310 RepID=UPI00296EA639|nr:glycosyltransferase [Muricauda sp. D6]